jgi:hypothetical protein
LQTSDLQIIGVYLYGAHWQCQLARAIQRSERLVRYWKSGERLVSIAASAQIEALVRHKHGQQMRRTRAYYLDMIATLSDTTIKARLLTMDLPELRVDNQVRQTALIEADIVLALVAETKTTLERQTIDLHTLCSLSYCALRAIAPQRQGALATTPGAGARAPPPRPVHGRQQG